VTIESIDATPIIAPPEPPKRGRGRPRKDGTPVGSPRSASSKRVRTARKPSAPRGPRSLRPELSAFLTLVNSAVVASPLGTRPVAAIYDPNIQPERVGDELDAVEIDALARAIDTQCQRSPRFRKYVEGMLTVGAGGQLMTVVMMIAARRASRHGLISPAVDPMLGLMMGTGDLGALGDFAPAPPPDTTPDETTGETPPLVVDAPNGNGTFSFDDLGG